MLESETAGSMKDSCARPCDACRSAASSVYCRTDLAYLCSPCDVRIHPASLHDHERVWVCESCERAPAAFLCKADSASLCGACDGDIHSANPLARRHLRVPVQPIPTSLYCPINLAEDEDEEAWLLQLNPMKNGEEEASFGDEYLDLDEYNQLSEGYSCNNQQQHYGGDSIVPIKYEEGNNCFQLGMGYTAITYPPSISQTVSISSMDVGIVPESENEASMMSQSQSQSHTSSTRAPKGTIDLFSSPLLNQAAAPTQLSPMDREARVMRYREKKKTRKFEKTIRYASRKAYAETRPRIKGRFAKRRAQLQLDDHQIFSSQPLMPSDYGVVPSF